MGLERGISDKLQDGSPATVGAGTGLEDYWPGGLDFPGDTVVKNSPVSAGVAGGSWFDPWVRKIP